MKKALFSIVFMFIVTFVFTSLVSAVKFLNEDKIRQNENLKFQKIVLQALGIPILNKPDKDIGPLFDQRIKHKTLKGRAMYIAYEENGHIVSGYAFSVGGSGFWGPIKAMVALNRDLSLITGISFYKHSETPGLGARITENWFTQQFVGLSLHSVKDDRRFFYLKPGAAKTGKKDLDAITGATGTSRAVEKFLNAELAIILKDVESSISPSSKG